MALSLRPYDPSNQEDTCLWCGADLPHPKRYHGRNGRGVPTNLHPVEVGGYESNGFFCTIGCGYQFGLTFAKQGRRLAPRPHHTPVPQE